MPRSQRRTRCGGVPPRVPRRREAGADVVGRRGREESNPRRLSVRPSVHRGRGIHGVRRGASPWLPRVELYAPMPKKKHREEGCRLDPLAQPVQAPTDGVPVPLAVLTKNRTRSPHLPHRSGSFFRITGGVTARPRASPSRVASRAKQPREGEPGPLEDSRPQAGDPARSGAFCGQIRIPIQDRRGCDCTSARLSLAPPLACGTARRTRTRSPLTTAGRKQAILLVPARSVGRGALCRGWFVEG